MASALSKWLVDPKRNPLAAMHMKAVSTRLRRFGLRYDDLFDPMYELDVKEALDRLPREIVDARNQRLKRAMDLSMKHEYLPEDLQLVGNKGETLSFPPQLRGYADTISELPTGYARSSMKGKLLKGERSRESKLNAKHSELYPFTSAPSPERIFLAAQGP
ncbi:hypothetical protein SASPL_153128 [Salvia splendens]|uniref:Complex III subunit VII n=1 Tax=Salvia splendens TaxID=180675 RepID=A0A8X8W4L9_SALSN|nr:hypothetical protein SASPL_153128 [Salvia splendens]